MQAEPLGRAETLALLKKHGILASKSLGQHFLTDPNTIRKIVEISGISRSSIVLEIGPGTGTLTRALAANAERVIAVEKDQRFGPVLEETLTHAGNVTLIFADATKIDLSQIAGGSNRLEVVSNLPYNVATALTVKLLQHPLIGNVTVMLQREVAERFASPPGSKQYGAVTVKARLFADASIRMRVSRQVFVPPPDVDSAVVKFEKKPCPLAASELESFFRVVDEAFSVRRKTIKNALLTAGRESSRVEAALRNAGIEASRRAETLDLEEFLSLYKTLEEGA